MVMRYERESREADMPNLKTAPPDPLEYVASIFKDALERLSIPPLPARCEECGETVRHCTCVVCDICHEPRADGHWQREGGWWCVRCIDERNAADEGVDREDC